MSERSVALAFQEHQAGRENSPECDGEPPCRNGAQKRQLGFSEQPKAASFDSALIQMLEWKRRRDKVLRGLKKSGLITLKIPARQPAGGDGV